MATRRTNGSKRGGRRIGYAVAGLGHIAQTAVLPAFAHAKNSRLVALISAPLAFAILYAGQNVLVVPLNRHLGLSAVLPMTGDPAGCPKLSWLPPPAASPSPHLRSRFPLPA